MQWHRDLVQWKRDQAGQAMVELALIIPVIIFIFMGMLLVGYWMNAQQVVTAAAREGARAIAVTGDRSTVGTAVMSVMQILNTRDIDIGIFPQTVPCSGKTVYVTVTYQIPLKFKYFRQSYEEAIAAERLERKPYPFTQVVAQAAARMETNPPGRPDCG